MDDAASLDSTKRQTINPVIDEINKQTEPLLKVAMNEFGYKVPLTFRIYNQIRFYEEYGKLHLGMSVVFKETLAQQFNATIEQVEKAFDHLTNTHKLGRWIDHEESVFRNVKRTWVSNIRYKKGFKNSHSMGTNSHRKGALLPWHGSVTPIERELASEVAPLSESKKKVSESKHDTKVSWAKARFGRADINEIFDYWENTTGLKISSGLTANRRACSTLLNKYKPDELRRLIDGAAQAQADKYAPRISDLCSLQYKINDLLLWGKKKTFNKTGVEL